MAEAAAEKTVAVKKPAVKLTGQDLVKKRALRRRLRAAGRKKLAVKIRGDKEFAKTFFEARSKRANDKKAAFRKKKTRKK